MRGKGKFIKLTPKEKYEKSIDGMKIYTDEKIEKVLIATEFSRVVFVHGESHPWLTVTAEE